jgi:hypothetical protein
MPSSTYSLIAEAMTTRRQVVCTYGGYRRELCPVVLGRSDGEEKALFYQFAGSSSSRLPPGGGWKCMRIAGLKAVRLREGPWFSGSRHDQAQHCVKDVDLDVNPDSPYRPKRPFKRKPPAANDD